MKKKVSPCKRTSASRTHSLLMFLNKLKKIYWKETKILRNETLKNPKVKYSHPIFFSFNHLRFHWGLFTINDTLNVQRKVLCNFHFFFTYESLQFLLLFLFILCLDFAVFFTLFCGVNSVLSVEQINEHVRLVSSFKKYRLFLIIDK